MTFEFKTKPFEHQKKALKAANFSPAFAYLMEMGTGKSKVMIDEAAILHDRNQIDTMVVACPKGIVNNWVENELPTHMGTEYEALAWDNNQSKYVVDALLAHLVPDTSLRVLVINVEAVSASKRAEAYLKKFIESGRCYFAIDESTVIKNPTSKRTKKLMALGRLAKYRRIATGSPTPNSPLDAYSQFEFLEPGCLGSRSYFAFRARYSVLQEKNFGGRRFQIPVAYKNLDELNDRVGAHSYRVLKEECLDLIPKLYTTREVELTDKQRKMYDEMRNIAMTEIGGSFVSSQSAITTLMRLQQIVCGHVRDEDGNLHHVESNRINVLLEALEDVTGDVIIWTCFRETNRQIKEALEEQYGTGTVAQFYGGNVKTRDMEAQAFKENPVVRFMVASQGAGGRGNTWTNATTVVYFANDYDLEKRIQSEDRAHRAGQTNKVTYIDLIARGTTDERIVRALKNKINIAERIMGDDPREWLI